MLFDAFCTWMYTTVDGEDNIFALLEGGDLAKIKDGIVVWCFSNEDGQAVGSLKGQGQSGWITKLTSTP
jgi:hypothetical protein